MFNKEENAAKFSRIEVQSLNKETDFQSAISVDKKYCYFPNDYYNTAVIPKVFVNNVLHKI